MKHLRRVLALALAAAVVMAGAPGISSVATSLDDEASQIQQKIDQTEEEAAETSSDLAAAQSALSNLQSQAKELGGTYSELSSQLSAVLEEVSAAAESVIEVEEQIALVEEEIAEIEAEKLEQYAGMKKRIQFMYEYGTNSLLAIILESGSIADFMKRMEYVSMIVAYDRNAVEELQALQDQAEAKAAELEEAKAALVAQQEALSAKQDELGELVASAQSAYNSALSDVDTASMTVAQLDAYLDVLEAQRSAYASQYASIQAQMAQEYAAYVASTSVEEDTTGSISYDTSDLQLLASIIYAEARGESYAGQLAVGSVIMNRVKSSYFPNTLSGVIYQTNQFQPVRDGSLAVALALSEDSNSAMASCYKAARAVLDGYRSGDWLFFMTPYWANYYGITGYTVIGNHAFFKVWGANTSSDSDSTDTGNTDSSDSDSSSTDSGSNSDSGSGSTDTGTSSDTSSDTDGGSSATGTSDTGGTSGTDSGDTDSGGTEQTDDDGNDSTDGDDTN